jgi:hypothetical protein
MGFRPAPELLHQINIEMEQSAYLTVADPGMDHTMGY